MAMSGEMMRPDFVLCGVSFDGGVVLFASETLTRAELETEVDEIEIDPMRWTKDWISRPTRRVLTATMRSYVMVRGATYREAMETLFTAWHPPDRASAPTPSPIPGGMKSLDALS